MEMFLSTALLIVFTTSMIVNYRLIKELENVKFICNKSLRYYESKLMKDQMELDFNNKFNNYNDVNLKANFNYVYEKNEVISIHT